MHRQATHLSTYSLCMLPLPWNLSQRSSWLLLCVCLCVCSAITRLQLVPQPTLLPCPHPLLPAVSAHLVSMHSAIKMLSARIRLIQQLIHKMQSGEEEEGFWRGDGKGQLLHSARSLTIESPRCFFPLAEGRRLWPAVLLLLPT